MLKWRNWHTRRIQNPHFEGSTPSLSTSEIECTMVYILPIKEGKVRFLPYGLVPLTITSCRSS